MSIILVLIPFVFYRYILKNIKDKFTKGTLGKPTQCVLTETHFTVTNDKGNSYSTTWENINAVDEAEDFFMIFLDDITAQILIKNQMNYQQISEISSLLKDVSHSKLASKNDRKI